MGRSKGSTYLSLLPGSLAYPRLCRCVGRQRGCGPARREGRCGTRTLDFVQLIVLLCRQMRNEQSQSVSEAWVGPTRVRETLSSTSAAPAHAGVSKGSCLDSRHVHRYSCYPEPPADSVLALQMLLPVKQCIHHMECLVCQKDACTCGRHMCCRTCRAACQLP